MKSLILLSAAFACEYVAYAQEPVPNTTISICDLLRDPSMYNGEVISLRGVYFPGGHGLYLKGEGCDGTLNTRGYRWPSLVWIVNNEQEMQRHGRSMERYLQALVQVADAGRRELLRKSPGAKIGRVIVTYTGLFETRDDLASAVFQRPDGSVVGIGFGEAPGAPGQLFVDSVKDIAVEFEPATNPEKTK